MKKILIFVLFALLVMGVVFSQEQQTEEQKSQEQEQVKEQPKEQQKEPEVEKKQEEKKQEEEQPVVKSSDLKVGKIYFPRAFVHAKMDYIKGTYIMELTEKDGEPWFKVYDKGKKFLFEEMAVVKAFKNKRNRRGFRVRKELLRGYEYFRVTVYKGNKRIMAYFLLKGAKEKPEKKKSRIAITT